MTHPVVCGAALNVVFAPRMAGFSVLSEAIICIGRCAHRDWWGSWRTKLLGSEQLVRAATEQLL